MKKRKSFILVVILVFLMVFVFYNMPISKKEDNKRMIKIGFYDYYPYFYINKDSKVCGEYNDLVKSLSEKLDFNFEYVNCSISESLKQLENREIDLVFGINKTPEREKLYEFSDDCIDEERYVIYTNKNIKYGNIKALNGLKMGYIEGETNNEWVLKYLKNKNINVELVNISSYKAAESLLIENKVDFIVGNSESDIKDMGKNIRSIFGFSAGPTYIVAKKNDKELISEINKVLKTTDYKSNRNNNIYYKYFSDFFNNTKNILISISILLILIISVKKMGQKIIIITKQKKITNDLKKDNYTLYYQPIVDFKSEKVRGFEALLRLIKNGEVLTPYHFLKDIEESNMMQEVTLWILKRVISDYDIIKKYDFVDKENFYISLNVSFKEIEDLDFLNEIIKIVKEKKVKENTICLEIVEKFGVEEIEKIEKIQENMKFLKENGILIAIDDFGVEYSNLDLLKKIDSNIIKLDKFFVDGLNDSIISIKVIDFILEICKLSNKSIVIEGVEEKYQVDIIKTFLYEKIYIQGYYFSKPLDITSLRNLNIIT
ncbi:EAL domain-containing protein [Clostridium sp. LIBA-8841]|uniref:EAL domain-containing protein n=1 Tax=Clostridium sp. LIBA-8841 TaxID=2987530 RepID=UPI002AC6DEED|nr:EAL domain-containing protein [Clostridium sp. LIBA-8841]MDZ5253661.1 EAL domain-containing protein [Clostridium sp. LIBA-8841]